MNKAYRVVFNRATGVWAAASEMACGRGKGRTAARATASVLIAGAAVVSASGVMAQTVGGGLQLCVAGGAGTSLGSGGLGLGGALGCTGSTVFSLNNASSALGGAAATAPTASVTGFSNGLLELRGNSGISLLGATTFNADAVLGGNKITGLGAGTVDTDAANTGQVRAVQAGVNALTNGTAGLVQQNAFTETITVGKDVGGTDVSFANMDGNNRRLTNVANGRQTTDAVNLGQLNAVEQQAIRANTSAAGITTALGGGAAINPNGSLTAPTYTLGADRTGATQYHTVADALGNLDNRVTDNSIAITNLSTQLGNGEIGLVRQDAVTKAITVASATGGTSVDVTGTDGVRTLSGLKDATLSDSSTEAVTGRQLNDTNTALSTLQSGTVQYDDASKRSVTFNNGGAAVQLKNVADGTDDTDAVNIRQLKSAGLVGDDGQLANVVTYDDSSKSKVSLQGGPDGTTLTNVRAGSLTGTSMDAVNGAQLYATNQTIATALGTSLAANGSIVAPAYTVGGQIYNNVGDVFKNLDGRVTGLEQGGSNSGGGGGQTDPRFSGSGSGNAGSGDQENAQATGVNATAAGAKAAAAADHSVALGAGSVASKQGSVALGAGSVADRENTVSVGSAGNERILANVMDGTQATDAVNKAQLDRVDSKIADTQQSLGSLQNQVGQLDSRINRIGAMNSAMSTMMASAAGLQTDNRMAIGSGLYRGQTALAIGYQRKVGSRATVTVGGSTAGGSEYNIGVGAGYGW